MGSRHSFHRTGVSCRASGYGELAGQYLPTPGPFACEPPPEVVPGLVHASRMAAPGSARTPAAADRLRISRLVSRPGQAGRSFGCLAIAGHTLSPMPGLVRAQALTGESTGNSCPTFLVPQPLARERDRSAIMLVAC